MIALRRCRGSRSRLAGHRGRRRCLRSGSHRLPDRRRSGRPELSSSPLVPSARWIGENPVLRRRHSRRHRPPRAAGAPRRLLMSPASCSSRIPASLTMDPLGGRRRTRPRPPAGRTDELPDLITLDAPALQIAQYGILIRAMPASAANPLDIEVPLIHFTKPELDRGRRGHRRRPADGSSRPRACRRA